LTSLVSAVALTGQAPFSTLKTHGLLIDNEGEKISKSKNNSNFISTEDLILGTVKLDG
jgi:isoleucyl-tRNA synthetase